MPVPERLGNLLEATKYESQKKGGTLNGATKGPVRILGEKWYRGGGNKSGRGTGFPRSKRGQWSKPTGSHGEGRHHTGVRQRGYEFRKDSGIQKEKGGEVSRQRAVFYGVMEKGDNEEKRQGWGGHGGEGVEEVSQRRGGVLKKTPAGRTGALKKKKLGRKERGAVVGGKTSAKEQVSIRGVFPRGKKKVRRGGFQKKNGRTQRRSHARGKNVRGPSCVNRGTVCTGGGTFVKNSGGSTTKVQGIFLGIKRADSKGPILPDKKKPSAGRLEEKSKKP